MNGGHSILGRGNRMKDAGDRKMEILVYICPFPSQAIFHGDLRIVRRGENSFGDWAHQAQAALKRNL